MDVALTDACSRNFNELRFVLHVRDRGATAVTMLARIPPAIWNTMATMEPL